MAETARGDDECVPVKVDEQTVVRSAAERPALDGGTP